MRRLYERWQRGESAVNGWLMLSSPVIAEIFAGGEFDALTIDMQHGLVGYRDALSMLQAMRAGGVTPFVRVPSLDSAGIGKVLDAGALGIICPMVNDAHAARELVRACRYAPDGVRSFGPVRSQMVYGSGYPAEANELVIVFAMIETAEGFQNVEETARVAGLDGLYIGPSDLALSFGEAPAFDHENEPMRSRIDAIRDAAHSAGIKAGIHCVSAEYANRMLDAGFDFVTVGSDIRWVRTGLSEALAAISRPVRAEVADAGDY